MPVLQLTKENFENEVVSSEKPVLIDFFASWCGPCRMVSPIVDEIASENEEFKICKVDVDKQPELAQAFNVSSIPTLVVVKQAKVVNRAVGAQPKEAILSMLEG